MSTAGTIKHAYTMTGTNNPAIQVSKDRWNADLVVAGGTNGWLLTRDSGQTDGWGWSTKIPSDGFNNVVGGTSAGNALTTGLENVLLGSNAGAALTTGQDCTFVGFHAGLVNTANYNTFIGPCGVSNTTGTNNTFVGYVAGNLNADGADNTFIGVNAGTTCVSGFGNTFVGSGAGLLTTGMSNTIVGNAAGAAAGSWNFNTYVGKFAGQVETGSANAYLGYKAGFVSTAGDRNTYLGNSAGFDATTGDDNTFLGYNAGDNEDTGSGNVAIGSGATLASGIANAVAIGYASAATAASAIAIGASITASVANTAVIGGTSLSGVRFGGSGSTFSLGSGGVSIYAAGGSSGAGFVASSTATADASDIGYIDFATTGTAGGEKRGGAIHTLLVGSAATTVTADMLFYTTNAGTIAEKLRVKAGGQLLIAGGTAVPAGGTTGLGLAFSSTANLGIYWGSGAPTLSAAKGSVYFRTDGSSSSTRAYSNTDGATTWTNFTTAA